MSGKNIVIVTASIGSGHSKAANAIAEAVKEKYPDNKIHIVDFVSNETGYINTFVKDIYLKLLDYTPNIYEYFYKFSAGTFNGSKIQSIFAMAMKKEMKEIVEKYQADMLICTHPFPCGAASLLKANGVVNIPIIAIITDFCFHQFWLYSNMDIYFVANENIKNDLVKHGIPEEKIKITGIPIGLNFTHQENREELLKKLKLSPDKPILLIMGGGLGLGHVMDALSELERLKIDLQILVVTGANVSLWSEVNEFAQKSHHKIQVWGYSHNVQELMSVATILISKPGALTISEALASGLPMILHNPIPGPEVENAKFVAEQGAAVWVEYEETLSAVVREMISDKTILPRLIRGCKKLAKPYAAEIIVDDINKQYPLGEEVKK